MQSVPLCTRKRQMKMNDNPAVLSPSKTFGGVRETKSSSITLEPTGIKHVPYQIDRDVFDHLPKMYQKMAAVFAASGKVVIIDNMSGGSFNE